MRTRTWIAIGLDENAHEKISEALDAIVETRLEAERLRSLKVHEEAMIREAVRALHLADDCVILLGRILRRED